MCAAVSGLLSGKSKISTEIQTDLYYVWLTALCSFISTCINFTKANGKFFSEIYYLLKKTLKRNTGLPLIQSLVTTSFW